MQNTNTYTKIFAPMRYALLIGGFITTMIGIGHIFMPTMGYDSSVPASLDPLVRDHFYYLGTYAICSFLLSFGFLSLYFSRLQYPKISLILSSVYMFIWVSRAIMEFIYPVELQIFFLEKPHGVLTLTTVFLAILYTLGTLHGWANIKKAVTL